MTPIEIRSAIVNALRRVAPETDPASMDENAPLREALDIDSMDFLNVVIALHEALHVDIPEADYPKIATMKGAVAYLTAKLDAPRG